MAKTVKPKGAAKRYKKRAVKGKKKYTAGIISVTTPKARKKKHILGAGVIKTGKRRTTAVFTKKAPMYSSISTIGKKELITKKRRAKKKK